MRTLILFFLFASSIVSAQVTDNFSDGDFTTNPTWSGDDSVYTIVSNKLRSNKTIASSIFYLSTPSTLATNCQWEFWVNLQFNTSSANFVDVYLTSDQANLMAATINGYFVRLGNTTDDVCLYKKVNGTATKIIDGIDGILNTSNTTLKVKVVRDASNNFTLSRDMGATGNYTVEGAIVDASSTSSSFFGVNITQSTASFFQKHFFDDFYVGPIILDLTAPTIVSSTVISNTQLDILFDESVDLTTSQTLTNYSASNGLGNPSVATRDAVNLSLVHLIFATSFTNALSNTLTVTNVQDLSTNAITTATSNFTYFAPVVASYKDVIINEIMASPNPQVALPPVEFVELFNRSTNTINLNGWKLSDATGSSSSTLGNYNLAPNQYLIICKNIDTTSFSTFGNYLGVSSMPSLNDSGDNLKLKDNTLLDIDSVNYSDTWYQDVLKKGGGWTLELINPNAPLGCPASNNWIASNNSNGGTPGIQNSVYSTAADIISPSIVGVTVIDSTHITICFSEALDASQLAILSNYSISNGIGTPLTGIANSTYTCVDLSLANALASPTTYTLTFTNLSDCSGNALIPTTTTFTYYKVKSFDVVINEIMADPDPVVNLPNYEYVELFNRTQYPINLNNWTFTTGTSSKVLPNVFILPDSFVVIISATGVANYPAGTIEFAALSSVSLTNTGQTLILQNPEGKTISTVSYTDNWYQDATKKDGGYSLEQVDPNNPCAGMSNWRASTNSFGGTPGKKNSVVATNADNTPPQVVRVSVIATDTIQLYFNEPLDSTTMLNTSVYSIDNGIGAPTQLFTIAPDFKSVRLTLATALQVGIIYTVTVNNAITDCVGNPIGTDNSARFAIPEPALPNDIVINEILFDPNVGGVDFVEIYNRSNKVIDLKTMNISQYDTINNVQTSIKTITTDGYLIFPKDYLVLSTDGAAIKSQYNTSNPEGFLDLPSMPSMNIDGGTICLATISNIIDNFKYYADMHFGLLNITKGISLERINFDRPTQDRTNWHSAAEDVGFATPAYKNSQYADAGETDNVLEITPEIFSPDEDGNNDVVNINYHFDTPGFTANVTIYDSKGRVVKQLIRNELLGIKGTYSWDGINENREKARIGIYIIFFEVFDLKGTVKHYKKTCVLGGKL